MDLLSKTDDELYEKIRYCGDDNGFSGNNAYNFDVVNACKKILKSRHTDKTESIETKIDEIYNKAFEDGRQACNENHQH